MNPRDAPRWLRTAAAIGERQVLPVQTNNTEKVPSSARLPETFFGSSAGFSAEREAFINIPSCP